MNFLAHVALSGNRAEVLMGNYVGDFVKGKLTSERTAGWAPDFTLGIKLHRFIDDFTDTHPTVLAAKKVVSVAHPKVGSVALDIYFDYLLANRFSDFYSVDLMSFVKATYRVISRNKTLIPLAMLPMAEAMIRHDWLGNYKDISGIARSFNGLANRFEFMKAIAGAEHELIRNQSFYTSTFLTFYPQLQKGADDFIISNSF